MGDPQAHDGGTLPQWLMGSHETSQAEGRAQVRSGERMGRCGRTPRLQGGDPPQPYISRQPPHKP